MIRKLVAALLVGAAVVAIDRPDEARRSAEALALEGAGVVLSCRAGSDACPLTRPEGDVSP